MIEDGAAVRLVRCEEFLYFTAEIGRVQFVCQKFDRPAQRKHIQSFKGGQTDAFADPLFFCAVPAAENKQESDHDKQAESHKEYGGVCDRRRGEQDKRRHGAEDIFFFCFGRYKAINHYGEADQEEGGKVVGVGKYRAGREQGLFQRDSLLERVVVSGALYKRTDHHFYIGH